MRKNVHRKDRQDKWYITCSDCVNKYKELSNCFIEKLGVFSCFIYKKGDL